MSQRGRTRAVLRNRGQVRIRGRQHGGLLADPQTVGLAIVMALLALAGMAHVTTRFYKARNIAR
jgi:hypothetical protein